MILKDYQEKAVHELLEYSRELLKQNRIGAKIVFDAPTGSGKTIMMAELLKQLSVIKDPPLSFIWTAPRKLHYQSKEKLEKYYEGSATLDCIEFNHIKDYMIQESQALFLNWESINKKDAIITRENERDFYLRKIIDKTRGAGHKIILIIDESHHHATSEISQNIIHDIAPDLVIEVSATPILKGDRTVNVYHDNVCEVGMIKKSICFNPDFGNWLENGELQSEFVREGGSREALLKKALEKRQELADAYKEEGSNINPLMLIQLPDRGTPEGNAIFSQIKDYLQIEHGITQDNRKLAVYLSEDKQNLENLQKPDNETEVLIFKQAIALGWDCPRAHILVLLRDWKSFVFSIQTVGRIMRMPEPDKGHYEKKDILNHGYVFSDIKRITFKNDLTEKYFTINISKRLDSYDIEPLMLESFYKVRHREKDRLSPRFTELFFAIAETYDLKDRIDLNDKDIELSWIADFVIDSVDSLIGTKIESNKTFSTKSNPDMQKAFDAFIIENIKPFYPQERTMGRVKEAINEFFNKLPFDYPLNHYNKNIRVVLNEANQKEFIEVIKQTIDKYIDEIQGKKTELKSYIWQVPETLYYKGDSKKHSVKKSVMKPFYYDGRWKTETAFIDFLDKSDKVEWWFKNGSSGPKFFAVDYVGDDGPGLFYVDFVVKFKNGTVGLFDPKSGNTIDEAAQKNDGLWSYMHKRSGIWGGIVTNPDTKNFKGKWKYYTGSGKTLTSSSLQSRDWKTLDI